jgi:tRNA (Thr-GGU) A37 N-methylase
MRKTAIPCWPIGVIRSGHAVANQTPIQPVYTCGCKGEVEICPDFTEGLHNLGGVS